MKRISVLIILPVLLFALEKVNLIKDHSFEKDSEVWHVRVGGTNFPNLVAVVNRHDSENALQGDFSGSGDTRTKPTGATAGVNENAYLTQGFLPGKTLMDIDSLILNYSTRAYRNDFTLTCMTAMLLHVNAQIDDYWQVGYVRKCPTYLIGEVPHLCFLEKNSFPEDILWHALEKNIYKDIEEWELESIPLDATLDSIILWVRGVSWDFPWQGQKVFFDDIRLMGYADYDVGVKAILDSVEDLGESANANSPRYLSYYSIPYIPAALIKNFGREPADFAVVAEILQGETQVYRDSIDWSLPSDTEDTVSFKSFTSPDTGAYLLRIYTVMDPDESDADDELTRELHFEAIAEPPVTHPQLLTLEVKPSMTTPLQVSYSLPKGHTGALTLFDLSGRRVDAKQVRGYGSATFNSDVAAGVYIVKLEAGGTTLSRKVIVVE